MVRFRIKSSGMPGTGIGWVGSRYFGKSGEIVDIDDPEMISLLKKTNLAEVLEDEGATKSKESNARVQARKAKEQ